MWGRQTNISCFTPSGYLASLGKGLRTILERLIKLGQSNSWMPEVSKSDMVEQLQDDEFPHHWHGHIKCCGAALALSELGPFLPYVLSEYLTFWLVRSDLRYNRIGGAGDTCTLRLRYIFLYYTLITITPLHIQKREALDSYIFRWLHFPRHATRVLLLDTVSDHEFRRSQ